MSTVTLMLDQTNVGLGAWQGGGDSSETNGKKSVQVGGAANGGSWTATVKIWAANDQRFPNLVGTFSLSDTTPSDAVEINFKWEFYRAELVAVTGAATKVSAIMSV